MRGGTSFEDGGGVIKQETCDDDAARAEGSVRCGEFFVVDVWGEVGLVFFCFAFWWFFFWGGGWVNKKNQDGN